MSTIEMADTASILLSFPRNVNADVSLTDDQYDKQVRVFLTDLGRIPGSTLAKGSDTDNDLLAVRIPNNVPYHC